MSRRHRTEIGRVYKTNDSLFSRDGYHKPNRRVVVVAKSSEKISVQKVKTLKPGRKKLIPIERYPDIRKPSGVETRTYSKTTSGKTIDLKKMKKTKTRLNKWDRKKIGI